MVVKRQSMQYFFDVNPDVFEVILDYLRHGSLDLPGNLSPNGTILVQAKCFGLDALVAKLGYLAAEQEKQKNHG